MSWGQRKQRHLSPGLPVAMGTPTSSVAWQLVYSDVPLSWPGPPAPQSLFPICPVEIRMPPRAACVCNTWDNVCKPRAHELTSGTSSENMNSFIQGPRGQKARKYNNKEEGKKKEKMDCRSLNKIRERGVRKIQNCRVGERNSYRHLEQCWRCS